MKQTIFVSSVQKELASERRAVRDLVGKDPLLRRFFEVILFEDLPAADRHANEVYFSQVDRCCIYLGLFGNEYGYEDAEGLSPTEREFDRATAAGKTRLIFVKGSDDKARHPKMTMLVRKAGAQLIRRRFNGVPELLTALHASLADHLELRGMVQTRPFEERPCRDAGLDDIDPGAVAMFLRRAHNERQFPLAEGTPMADVLTHLHLLADGQLSNAAILLFGRDPQKFIPCSETRCMHFHGTEIQRPVPFYRIFKGNLFEQVDEAVDFVFSKVNRSVGTRAEGPRAPVRNELPENVVSEAVVNAIVHRDYTSSGAIQVSVFADRVEVWNPGELLPPLTAASLRKPHRSILRNTRIAEALYLAHYIEKYGTGTLMMIRESAQYALPEPRFGTDAPGEFGVTVWRDWLTDEVMAKLGLNERQRKAINHLKSHGQITNAVYRSLTGAVRKTAARDMEALVSKTLLRQIGATGRAAHYVLASKRDMNGTNGTRPRLMPKRDINGTNGTSAAGGIGAREGTGSQRAQEDIEGIAATKGQNGQSGSVPNDAEMTHFGKETCHKSAKPVRGATAKAGKAKAGGGAKRPDKMSSTPQVAGMTGSYARHPVGTQSGPSRDQVTPQVEKLLAAIQRGVMDRETLQKGLGLTARKNFRLLYLAPALDTGLIEMTVPDKPTSRLQKYCLTDKGRAWLRKARPPVRRSPESEDA